jgi:amino acid adenylation domain-containing protein
MSVSERLAGLSPEQRALFEKLREKQRQAAVRPPQPPPVPRVTGPTGEGDWPLSLDQERFWFMEQLFPGGAGLNISAASRMRGPLSLPAMAAALDEIVRRHAALRTSFPVLDGAPVQRVSASRHQPLALIDLSGLPGERKEPEVLRLVTMATATPFPLETGPLMRSALVRLAPRDHVCILTVHHLVTDWISFQIAFAELAALYEGRTLPPPPIHYPDFALWQRSWLQGEALDSLVSWWREQLAGFPLALELPTDRPRPAVARGRGDRRIVRVSRERSEAVRGLARREGATLFMTVLAATAALLHRLSGQEKLILGANNANRNRPELEPVLGCFLTQVPFPIDLTGDPTFRELLARVRKSALGALAHQDLPFGKLVEALQPERNASRQPVVQALVQVLDGQAVSADLAGVTFEPVDAHDGNARYDLMLSLFDHPDGLAGSLEHDSDLFDPTTVERWAELLLLQMDRAAADPELRLSELPALSGNAWHQALVEWNDTARALPAWTLPERFMAQAARTPDAVAVIGGGAGGETLTYGELDRRSDDLARRMDVQPDSRVALLLGRTPDVPVAILAAWKAGAAYIPLDPEWPAERLQTVLADAEPALLVHRGPLPVWGVPTLDLDEPGSGDGELPGFRPDRLAYLIYTSGTTGKPKAVMVEHGSVAAMLAAILDRIGAGPDERVPQLSRYTFDVTLLEMFVPLLSGGACEIVASDEVLDPAGFLDVLERSTRVFTVPALLRRAVAGAAGRRFAGLRTLTSGGDLAPPDLVEELVAAFPFTQIEVLYGPTETSIICTGHRPDRVRRPERSLIGRPLGGVEARVMDPRGRPGRPVPLGVPGELWIGGPGVARGYFKRPELTAERFVEAAGRRFYRTGDLVRQVPGEGGELEFLGRVDDQVKVRGFRIEPGEIEAALLEHPAVREAVVVALPTGGDKQLAAYVVGTDDAEALRAFLGNRLPDYMVPAVFVPLDALPVSAHGKVDRKALPAPGAVLGALAGSDAPRDEREALLAAIWREVLGLERVGIHDNFFRLGGDSILSIQVVARARQAGLAVTTRQLFENQTIAGLAAATAAMSEPGEAAPALDLPADRYPLAPLQEGMLFHSLYAPGEDLYFQQLTARLEGPLDAPAFAAAWQQVIERHAALRTAFVWQGVERPVQVVQERAELPWTFADWRGLPPAEVEARWAGLQAADRAQGFDLGQAPLLRLALVRTGERSHRLIWSSHHLIVDGWSLPLLLREVFALYPSGEAALPPARPYRDYIAWLAQRTPADTIEAERRWREALRGFAEPTAVPFDRPGGADGRRAGDYFERGSMVAAAGLQTVARRLGVTLNTLVQGAWALLLSRYAQAADVVFGAVVSGRPAELPGAESIVGLFINTVPVRTVVPEQEPAASWLARLQAGQLALRQVQWTPLPRIQALSEVPPGEPLFMSLLAFENHPVDAAIGEQRGEQRGELRIEEVAHGGRTNYPLTLTVVPGRDLSLTLSADRRFEPATAERLLAHLGNLLAALAADPDRPPRELPMLSAAERSQLLTGWNDTASAFPDLSIPELFAEQAALRPGKVAVEQGDLRLTYRELHERAEQMARHLRLKPEQPVAVLADRSPDLIVSLLAILRAGGAYLPLDPSHPQERRDWMVQDAGAVPLTLEETEAEPLRVLPESLAYVMYTSGSTGTPKGVAVTHRNVVRLLRGTDYAEMEHTWLQLAPVSFDASTLEIWAPLLNGGRLVLFPGRSGSLDEIAGVIERHGVTSAWLTAGLFHEMVDGRLDGLAPLRQLLAGGDVISPDHARRVLAAHPDLALINGYGPTEGTTFTCCHRIAEVGGTVPIGRPIANARVYVLDAQLDPVPVGAWGELYAGGEGVARGYLGRPDLTAERFVPDPFGEGRLYRTGDRVRWRADGTLEFQGRLDSQLKIRGFRVEPGEVEAALLACPGVTRGAVAVIDKALAAFWVGDAQADELRARLRERLPEPMVPSVWVPVPDLPLTPNGKVDRRALAALAHDAGRPAVEHVPPTTPLEKDLAAAWAEVLERDPAEIGLRDSFFDLGGHSLLATRLVSRLQIQGLDVPLQLVFDTADLGDLADRIVARSLGDVDDEELLALLEEQRG